MESETEGGAPRSRRPRVETEREEIVIRLPKIDPEAWNWFLDMIPGRGLLRVLSDPPDEFFQHARNARRERLLAVRSVIDALIEDTEQQRGSHPAAREVPID